MLSREHFKSDEEFIAALRDWFAGQALQIAELRGESPARVADWAYSIADAMLSSRLREG